MGITLKKQEFELHPEGWFPFAIVTAEETEGQYGPRIKWTLESKETKEDGSRHKLTYFTGAGISSKSNLGLLIEAAGHDLEDLDDEWDSDELLGSVVEGLVEERASANGTVFSNIVKVRRRKKEEKKAAASKVSKQAGEPFVDPFAEE